MNGIQNFYLDKYPLTIYINSICQFVCSIVGLLN